MPIWKSGLLYVGAHNNIIAVIKYHNSRYSRRNARRSEEDMKRFIALVDEIKLKL